MENKNTHTNKKFRLRDDTEIKPVMRNLHDGYDFNIDDYDNKLCLSFTYIGFDKGIQISVLTLAKPCIDKNNEIYIYPFSIKDNKFADITSWHEIKFGNYIYTEGSNSHVFQILMSPNDAIIFLNTLRETSKNISMRRLATKKYRDRKEYIDNVFDSGASDATLCIHSDIYKPITDAEIDKLIKYIK